MSRKLVKVIRYTFNSCFKVEQWKKYNSKSQFKKKQIKTDFIEQLHPACYGIRVISRHRIICHWYSSHQSMHI